MPRDARLDNLLLRWEEDQAVSPEELCANWPEGLGELRRHIALLEKLAPVLDLETASAAGGNTPGPATTPPAWPSLPDYEILGELGRGGMGIVYKARHLPLNRLVALKVLRPGVEALPRLVQRFTREARALARLRHENIVPIYEARLHRGQPYFAMQLVTGGNLARQLGHLARHPRAAVRLVEQVAEAVAHAHRQGVLHRDLKPANILLDERGQPLVSDFGLAKLLDRDEGPHTDGDEPAPRTDASLRDHEEELTPLTAQGPIPGTPPYMAPEQFRGTEEASAASTDVWALGVILYELLTGTRPFVSTEQRSLAKIVCEVEPPRPRTVQPKVDRPLEAVVLRCLHKDPARRYPSAGAVASELARWRRGEALEVFPERWPRRVGRRLRRRPALTTALCLLALFGLVLGTGVHRRDNVPVVPGQLEESDEDRYQKAVAGLKQDLADGKTVTLIDPSIKAPAFRWRAGQGRVLAPADTPDGEGLRLDAREPSLLEFLPTPDVPACRIVVKLRQDESHDPSGQVGIYAAENTWLAPAGPQHVFVRASYADLGIWADIFKDKMGQKSGLIGLDLVLLGTAPDNSYRRTTWQVGGVFFPAVGTSSPGPAPWRELTLDVRPDVFCLQAQGDRVLLNPAEYVPRLQSTVADQHPDLHGISLPAPLRGPLGIYVSNSSVTIQRLLVEPLGDKEPNHR